MKTMMNLSHKPYNITNLLPLMDLNNGPWIAGGAALNFHQDGNFLNANDVDIYFANKAQYQEFKQTLYDCGATDNHQQRQGNDYGHGALCWLNYIGYVLNCVGFRSEETAIDCINSFDITVCQFATDGKQVIHTPEAIGDLETGTLHFIDVNKSIADHGWDNVERRIKKYIKKGFLPDSEVTIKLMLGKKNHDEKFRIT